MPVRRNRYQVNLAPALKVWVERRGISQAQLARDLDFSANYAHLLIQNKVPFGPATFGFFIMVYGFKALEELFEIADVSMAGSHAKK